MRRPDSGATRPSGDSRPSTLSLLGLVRHLADVERSWFRIRLAGEGVTHIFFTETEPDLDFDGAVADPEEVATAFAAWRREVARAREITSAFELDDTFVHPGTGETLTHRWVLTHMIEEYARHNGHADLLREAIDGARRASNQAIVQRPAGGGGASSGYRVPRLGSS